MPLLALRTGLHWLRRGYSLDGVAMRSQEGEMTGVCKLAGRANG